METAGRTGSTTVVATAPGLATATTGDASSLLLRESAEGGPPEDSDAGRAEDRSARLVRELVEACSWGEVSQFEAPGFAAVAAEDVSYQEGFSRLEAAAVAEDGSDPGEVSRFEAPGFTTAAADGSPDGSEAPSDWNSVLPHVRPISLPVPTVGETAGEFRLLACLGRGVRGVVFLAEQPSLAHRPVVLKITARDGREHLSLAQLRHAHIVPLYWVEDLADQDLRLLCMPYLGGSPLGRLLTELDEIPIARRTGRDVLTRLDRIQAEAPCPVPSPGPARQFLARASYLQAVCWMGACLADALQFAHQRGLVHLDLKPSNILLAADGTPMLLDFHLAQPPIRPNESGRRWLGGTPHYMSPEQRVALTEIHDGRPVTVTVDGRSDIYGLGLVLYQMLGGAIAIGPYPAHRIPFRRPPRVPVGLGDIIAKCLAVDPQERYADAGQLAEDLRRHLADLPLRGVPNRSLTERCRKWCRRHPHALVRTVMTAVTSPVLILVAWLIASGDARQRLRGAESLLAESRAQRDRHDYPAAVRALNQGLALIEPSRVLSFDRDPARSQSLRRALRQELARTQQSQWAEEIHELADRLRFLYGTDLAARDALRALEHRLRTTWEARGRILAQLAGGLDPDEAQRFRTDFLDLAILWADLRVRLTAGRQDEARRDALRTLDEAERLFGASPVLARERQSHAEALGLADVARAAARSRAELVPQTAWEHYALGRSLLAAGSLEAAAVEFERATDLHPQTLGAQFARGICAYRRRCFETALNAFEVCVALSPGTAECYYNRGRAHAALGHAKLARRDYDHARRLAPAIAFTTGDRGLRPDRLLP
jgi:serine/threonine protein kinase